MLFFVKAWRTYMTESENRAITIMNTAKLLNGTTFQKIKILKARKRESAEQFFKFKQRMEAEFSRSNDEMERLKSIYQMALKEAGKLKEKLDDTSKKNKSLFQTFSLFITYFIQNDLRVVLFSNCIFQSRS